jgi:hypothetical protein
MVEVVSFNADAEVLDVLVRLYSFEESTKIIANACKDHGFRLELRHFLGQTRNDQVLVVNPTAPIFDYQGLHGCFSFSKGMSKKLIPNLNIFGPGKAMLQSELFEFGVSHSELLNFGLERDRTKGKSQSFEFSLENETDH